MFDRMEKGIERAVNGAFAKAFRSEVQPVEIASALRREVDDRATVVGRERTLVPNTFVVELGPADQGRLGEWEDALKDELRDVVSEHAAQQQYAFVGPVTVTFEEAEDLDTGLFRVRSSTTKAPAPPTPPPGPAIRPPAPPPAQPLRDRPEPPARAAAPSPGRPALEMDGRTYPITAAVTVLGRGTEADVIVDDAGVSRRHAEVRAEGDQLTVVDLGSTNGTYVDGEKIAGVAALVDGSRIRVGRSQLTVRFGSW
jgi:hypothetical protein